MKKILSLSLCVLGTVAISGNAMAIDVNRAQNVTLSWDDIEVEVGRLEFNHSAFRYVDLSAQIGSDFEACEIAVKWIDGGAAAFQQSTTLFVAEKLTSGKF